MTLTIDADTLLFILKVLFFSTGSIAFIMLICGLKQVKKAISQIESLSSLSFVGKLLAKFIKKS